MRIYRNLFEAAREVERDLFEMGVKTKSLTHQNHDVSDSDDFESRELMGYTYSIPLVEDITADESAFKALEYMGKNAGDSINYCATEMGDRLTNCTNPGTSYLLNRELWEQFMTAGKFDYTYAERFWKGNQLVAMIRELERNLESRRAILSIYDLEEDTCLREEGLRIPCSMYYQILIREEGGEMKLNLIYVMRSCDLYEHWVHDVIMANALAFFVAKKFNVKLGRLIHQMGSLHMFKKDYSKRSIY